MQLIIWKYILNTFYKICISVHCTYINKQILFKFEIKYSILLKLKNNIVLCLFLIRVYNVYCELCLELEWNYKFF